MKKSGENKRASGPLKQVFRSKLGNYSSQPGEQLWERLELSLDRQQVDRDRRRLRIFLNLAAAVALLLLCTGGWLAWLLVNENGDRLAAEAKNRDITAEIMTDKVETESGFPEPIIPESNVERFNPISPESGVSQLAGNENQAAKPLNTGREIQLESRPGKIFAKAGKRNIQEIPGEKEIESRNSQHLITETGTIAAKMKETVQDDLQLAAIRPLSEARSPGNPEKNNNADPDEPAGATAAVANENETRIHEEKAGAGQITQTSVALADTANTDSTLNFALRPELLPLPEEPVPQLSAANFPWSAGLAVSGSQFNENVELVYEPRFTYTGAGVNNMAEQEALQNAVAETNKSRQPGPSYQVNVQVSKQIGRFISLNSGVSYSRFSSEAFSSYIIRQQVQSANPTPTSNSNDNFVSLQQTVTQPQTQSSFEVIETQPFSIQTTYQYLSLPVSAQFTLPWHNWSLFVAPGIQVSRLLNAQLQSDQPQLEKHSYGGDPGSPYRSWLVSGIFSAGIGYRLAGNWQLRASADLQQGFSGITNKDSRGVTSTNPSILSGSVGFWYTFSSGK